MNNTTPIPPEDLAISESLFSTVAHNFISELGPFFSPELLEDYYKLESKIHLAIASLHPNHEFFWTNHETNHSN